MATKLNRRKTPLKDIEDVDPKTPTKILPERIRRVSSRSKSVEECEDTPSPQVASTRRSTRISAKKRTKLQSTDDSVDDDYEFPDAKSMNDDDSDYDLPVKNYFNENPDDHVHGFTFKTPKKKDGMVTLAYNTPKRMELKPFGTPKTPKTPKGLATPRTPKTPKSSRKLIQPKTPSNLRAKLQKGDFLLFNSII